MQRARDFFLKDTDYPTKYEPSGHDFFSSCLNEADLMRRVLSPDEFSKWFDGFLPSLSKGDGGNLLVPVMVSDMTDGKLVHSPGWIFREVGVCKASLRRYRMATREKSYC